jgi:hypothetical protein
LCSLPREEPVSCRSIFGWLLYYLEWPCKVLGLVLDKNLTFSPNFDYISDSVQKLTRLSTGGLIFTLDQKVLLYKAIFQFTILYSSVVWRGCAENHKRRLQILQHYHYEKFCHRLVLANNPLIEEISRNISWDLMAVCIVSDFCFILFVIVFLLKLDSKRKKYQYNEVFLN